MLVAQALFSFACFFFVLDLDFASQDFGKSKILQSFPTKFQEKIVPEVMVQKGQQISMLKESTWENIENPFLAFQKFLDASSKK